MVTARQLVFVGLLAILPAVIYGTLGPDLSALVAVVNVLIITVSLYIAFGPAQATHGSAGSHTA